MLLQHRSKELWVSVLLSETNQTARWLGVVQANTLAVEDKQPRVWIPAQLISCVPLMNQLNVSESMFSDC